MYKKEVDHGMGIRNGAGERVGLQFQISRQL